MNISVAAVIFNLLICVVIVFQLALAAGAPGVRWQWAAGILAACLHPCAPPR